jgi:hypothetical protein
MLQALVDSILTEVQQIPKALITDLETDLFKLINKHSYIQANPYTSIALRKPITPSVRVCSLC